jgi:hypothetical protein
MPEAVSVAAVPAHTVGVFTVIGGPLVILIVFVSEEVVVPFCAPMVIV